MTNRKRRPRKPQLVVDNTKPASNVVELPTQRWVACETYFLGVQEPIFFIFREGVVPVVLTGTAHGHVGMRFHETTVWRDPHITAVNLDLVAFLRPTPLMVTDVRPAPPSPENTHIAPDLLAQIQADLEAGTTTPGVAEALAPQPVE